jgi:hypothetical protein
MASAPAGPSLPSLLLVSADEGRRRLLLGALRRFSEATAVESLEAVPSNARFRALVLDQPRGPAAETALRALLLAPTRPVVVVTSDEWPDELVLHTTVRLPAGSTLASIVRATLLALTQWVVVLVAGLVSGCVIEQDPCAPRCLSESVEEICIDGLVARRACPVSERCFDGLGCRACEADTIECDVADDGLLRTRACADDGSRWSEWRPCVWPTPACSADRGCSVCVPSARRCNPETNAPEQCDPTGTGWLASGEACEGGQVCASGRCTPLDGLCERAADLNTELGCEFTAFDTYTPRARAFTPEVPTTLLISNPWDAPAEIHVFRGGLDVLATPVTIAPGTSERVTLPYEPVTDASRLEAKSPSELLRGAAFSVRSDLPVGAQLLQASSARSGIAVPADGTTLIPTAALPCSPAAPCEYLVNAWVGFQDFGSYVAVANAAESIAHVDVEITGSTDRVTCVCACSDCDCGCADAPAVRAGMLTRFELDPGDVLVLRAAFSVTGPFYDFTSTRVLSDAPVVVLAGAAVGLVPPTVGAGGHVEELQLPVSTWGRTFAFTPVTVHGGEPTVVRIVAAEDDTRVVFDGTADRDLVLGRRESLTLYLHEPAMIRASAPISVATMTAGSHYYAEGLSDLGGPSLAMLRPLARAAESVWITAPPLASSELVLASSDPNAVVRIDDAEVSAMRGGVIPWLARVRLSSGLHRLVSDAPLSTALISEGPGNEGLRYFSGSHSTAPFLALPPDEVTE